MGNNKIKYYPVNNGDTTLLTLQDNTTILIDCNIREGKEDNNGIEIFDVKKDLLDSLQKRSEIPFVDLFMLTHPDEDHCRGFKKNFYTGDPDDYSESNNKNGEIIIDEIWVTSMLFTSNQSDDANSIRNEVNRRKRLTGKDKDKRGNRLRLIGYDDNDKFDNVDKYIPGQVVNNINGIDYDNFSLFIHAPFKQDLITSVAEKDRNSSSIVIQARFKDEVSDSEFKSFALFGGDADHYIWEKILTITEENSNEEYLKWDLLLAPHHCSWSFFNNVPYDDDDNNIPKNSSLKILEDYKEKGAKIICSSKKVIDKKPNPPHYAAKEEYVKKLDSKDDFIELAVITDELKPEPIEYIITNIGVTKLPNKIVSAINSGGNKGASATVVKNG